MKRKNKKVKKTFKTQSSFIHKNNKDYSNELIKGQKHLSKNDLVLKAIIKKTGDCTVKPHKRYFETLVKSIVSQQLSVKAAASIFMKFKLLFADGNYSPPPEEIIAMPDDRLRGCGLSYPKISYIKDLSRKVLDGTVKIHKMGKLPDEEIINELIKVKGIGIWSAHMFLIFCLGRMNIFPVGDLGVRNGIMKNYKLKKMPDEKKMFEIAKKNNWEPYTSISSWYMWQSLKNEPVTE